MKRLRAALVAVAAGFAACDDAAILRPDLPGGCDSPRACQVTGVDLVADPIELLLPDGQRKDDVTGRLVLDPGEEFDIVVTIWNRGDRSSSAVPAIVFPSEIDFIVPPLAPGRVFTDTIRMSAQSDLSLVRDLDQLTLRLDMADGEDPLHGNETSVSDSFFIALPVLRATLEFPDTVRIGEPFNATVTIENVSRFGATEARPLVFCLIEFDIGCGLNGAGAPFGMTDVPVIAANSSWASDVVITIPSHAPYDEWDWVVVACLAEPGTALADFNVWEQPCLSDSRPITTLARAAGQETGS